MKSLERLLKGGGGVPAPVTHKFPVVQVTLEDDEAGLGQRPVQVGDVTFQQTET